MRPLGRPSVLLIGVASLIAIDAAVAAQPQPSPPPPVAFDEAAKALDRLGQSGADRSLLAGLPGESDRRLVESAARSVTGVSSAPTPGQRLLQGRAQMLLAALETKPEARREQAMQAAKLLAAEPLTSTAAEGLRRASLAAALWYAGGNPKEPGLKGDVDSPLELLRSVAEFPVGADPQRTIPRSLSVETLGLIVLMDDASEREADLKTLRAAASDAPRGTRPDPLVENFADEVAARAALRLDRPTGDAKLNAAIGTLLEPIAQRATRLADTGDGQRATLLRERVFQMLSRCSYEFESLPDSVKLAEAMVRITLAPTEPLSLSRLEAVAKSNMPEALWTLAVSNQRRGDTKGAALLYAQYAKRFPADRHAPEAMRIAVQLAEDSPDEQLARALFEQLKGTNDEARAAERLAVAMASGSSEHKLAGVPAMIELLDRARQLRPSEGERLLERQRAIVPELRSWIGTDPKPSAVAIAAAEAVEAWASKNDLRSAGAASALAGEVLSKFPERAAQAVESFKRALAARAGGPSHEAAIDGLARLAKGDRATPVFEELKRHTDACDAAASGPKPVQRPPSFWQAWYRMLGIMAAQNADGARSGQIRLRMRQLQTIDPDLGGGAWAEKLRQLERELK